jgi:hypothetical protein
LLLEQLTHQPQRRSSVASALDQHVEDLALVIDGTPEVHPLARDPNYQAAFGTMRSKAPRGDSTDDLRYRRHHRPATLLCIRHRTLSGIAGLSAEPPAQVRAPSFSNHFAI